MNVPEEYGKSTTGISDPKASEEDSGQFWSASRLSVIKCAAIDRAMTLAPELFSLGFDRRKNLPSVTCAGRGRLHLPLRDKRIKINVTIQQLLQFE